MTAFSVAIDVIFNDPNLGIDALFTPAGGVPVAVRAIRVQPQDVISGLAGIEIVSSGNVFDVRQSEVPNPQSGDSLTVDGVVYAIQGSPKLDQAKKTWQLDTYK